MPQWRRKGGIAAGRRTNGVSAHTVSSNPVNGMPWRWVETAAGKGRRGRKKDDWDGCPWPGKVRPGPEAQRGGAPGQGGKRKAANHPMGAMVDAQRNEGHTEGFECL